MGTRLKNNAKSYLRQVWLIEICYLVVFTVHCIIETYRNENYFESIMHISRETMAIDIITIIGVALEIFLFVKLAYVLLEQKRKFKIKGNFVLSIAYIFRYGFKYDYTKKALIGTAIVIIIFFIVYLYLLAIGGYENNILISLFTVYPFKGSIIIVLIPITILLYSLKKTIEILRINDNLRNKDNEGFQYDINDRTSTEIRELINNIANLKDSYQLVVDDRVRNERLKTELISNVSHDLRTPLTSIINYVNILEEDGLTEDEKKEYLKIIDKKSKKLKILIDDLFEMSKINSGKIELNKETIDILSLIHQTIGEYSYLYEDKNIEFNVESFSEEIPMSLDGKMISRAIENIVINALKYSLENTRIYVTISSKNKIVEIAFKNVSNYFMDFDPDEIFERFARGDKSRNSNIEGSGLGLAITKSIVELHDGEVRIKREGDMFKIYVCLPMDGDS